MKRCVCSLLLIIGTLAAAFAATARAAPTGTQIRRIPGVEAPPPAGNAPPPGRVGPTDNITKVANAIQVLAKSLTTLVVVMPGLALTQPVTISIGYYSPAGNKRITQPYVASGNRFLYSDPEGDGKPRQMRMDMTFSENKPGGGIHSYTVPSNLILDPLYDVTIGSLEFWPISACDVVGDYKIQFGWVSPDHQDHRFNFNSSYGQHTTIPAFAWSRTEVSASAKFDMPEMRFYEDDVIFTGDVFSFAQGSLYSLPSLLPGTTRQVVTTLTEKDNDCKASTRYNITYKLNLDPPK
jgi:hypothetical protein